MKKTKKTAKKPTLTKQLNALAKKFRAMEPKVDHRRKKYFYSITQIESIHHNIPRGTYDGYSDNPPTLGESFLLHTPGRDFTYIATTPILEIIKLSNGSILYKTKNSTYRLDPNECE